MSAILEAHKVVKTFGGLTAVNKVDVSIEEHSIYSIIGPNGAGKTTFFNCTSGFYVPDRGDIIFAGTPIQGMPTDAIAHLGISRTYQNIRLFSNMTAIENIIVGQHTHLRASWVDAVLHSRRFRSEEKFSVEEARRLLKFVGLAGLGDTLALNLPYGAQRRLELARALSNKPRLLLLDEPTAGMNPQETDSMTKFIRQLRDDLGITILLIEHDMRVVMGISDRITVMDFGEVIACGNPQEIQTNPRVIEAYLGPGATALSEKYRHKRVTP